MNPPTRFIFFFFNDPATTEIYPLSLHDALPIYQPRHLRLHLRLLPRRRAFVCVNYRLLGEHVSGTLCESIVVPETCSPRDRKSTRLNSSHVRISYAVFCLKKKKRLMTSCYTSIL